MRGVASGRWARPTASGCAGNDEQGMSVVTPIATPPVALPPGPRARRRRLWRVVKRVLLVLLLAVVGFLALTRTGRYLVRAGWEEGKILARRRPIAEIVADPSTARTTREKLRLVLAA